MIQPILRRLWAILLMVGTTDTSGAGTADGAGTAEVELEVFFPDPLIVSGDDRAGGSAPIEMFLGRTGGWRTAVNGRPR